MVSGRMDGLTGGRTREGLRLTGNGVKLHIKPEL